MQEYKVVVLGSGGVGKSALTVKFVSGKFVERYDPTIEDFYRKEIMVGNNPAILEILDTAGTEQFASMRDLYIKNGHGFVIVYSIVSAQTFNDIRSLRDNIIRVKGHSRIPIILVGNKCDLESQREVDASRPTDLSKQWNCQWVEVSAKNDTTAVENVFLELVRQMTTSAPKKRKCIIL